MPDKRFNKREEDEKKEGYESVKTDLPSDRFSAVKQIVKPDEMGVTQRSTPKDVSNVAESAAKTLRSKIKLRPDVSVDDLGGKQVGGVPLAVETTLRNAAGARSVSPADDMSRTPYSGGKYRPETRYGKKRSEDLFELDNTITEQVVPIVDDLPDLKEAPDAKVGYNGRQQFKQTRQKKNYTYINGSSHEVSKLPQQLLNDVSADLTEMNQVIYTCGQVVTPIGANGGHTELPLGSDYPTIDGELALTGNDIMHKSNYMPVGLRFTVHDGHITAVSIDEYRFLADANSTVRDQANMNAQVDANNVAKTMVRLQTELGRETTDKWSALGYVIDQPYQFNMLMHDIEATTGAIMATAYRSAVSSLAYQRNITKKDGIGPQRNAIKMILEGYAGIMANNDRTTIGNLDFKTMIWNKNEYRKGSVAAMINMFDSVAKYRTKADLLGLQRSLGLHLSQADNNINPLHCKEEFIHALDKAHMFSTIDGTYNPFLSIYATKTIKLINPLSLNRFLQGWKNPALFEAADWQDARRNQVTGTYAQYFYKYQDLRNEYPTNIQHPIIEGLLKWMLEHEGAIVSTYGEGNVYIPFEFNMQSPNMLSFMLCSAAQDVNFTRNITFRDVLFAGDQTSYIWDDLKGLNELNPLYSSQLKIGKYDEPLTLGKLAPDTALRVLYNDHKQLTDHTNGYVQYDEPWYFNEQAFEREAGGSYSIERGFYSKNTPFNFSFPSIRDGVRHEYIDLIKGVSPQDVMLAMDRKLDIMRYADVDTVRMSSAYDNFVAYTQVTPRNEASINSQKIELSVTRYDDNSDGRIVTKYNLDAGADLDLPAMSHYCIPKEIGYIEDDYTGINVINSVTGEDDNHALTFNSTTLSCDSTDTSGVNSEYYNGTKAYWITSYRVESDSNSNGSIDRSAALTNTFYRFFASPNATTQNNRFIAETGLVVARGANGGISLEVPGIYNLGSNVESTHALDITISTDSQFIWTMLQRWASPVNPFANSFSYNNIEHSYDPFEMSYYFGVCGFLAADYSQYVLERLSIFDQLGMDYTEDVNIKNSLIFR